VRRVSPWEHARTPRLWLDRPVAADLADLHALHADPAVWRHFPSGRHATPERTVETLRAEDERWPRDRLSFWSVREADGGPVIGMGGCAFLPATAWWNLYYRLAPAVQGRGYATELAIRAIEAAHDVTPDRPVLAYLLEHNEASRRTAERVGLRLVWRGPDLGNPDPDAVRLVLVDREPGPALLAAIEERFRPPGAS
jgi:RimJ/RimL family protein N-acetyltransferase